MRLVARLPLPLVAALGLGVGGAALAPGAAAASCGDYVTVVDRLDGDGPTHPLPPAPCPGCSKAPAPPAAPLTAPTTGVSDSDHPTAAAEPGPAHGSASRWAVGRQFECRPIRPAGSIFHPPRVR